MISVIHTRTDTDFISAWPFCAFSVHSKQMYNPPIPEDRQHVTSWDFRQSLLEERIRSADADVVCFQEVSPESFEQDFQFMQELGYDGVELFRKGRFRPATFWKTDRVKHTDSVPAVHKDRTLLTAFQRVGKNSGSEDDEKDNQHWFVLNCHLQAGKQGKRRVRQIQEGTKAIITMANKLKGELHG